jgi:hypothetical protein
MLPDNYPVSIILKVDLPNAVAADLFEMSLHDSINLGRIDGFYFLTRNGQPIQHSDEHLELENRMGRAISAIQNNDILIAGLADTDPETGIEYGELT